MTRGYRVMTTPADATRSWPSVRNIERPGLLLTVSATSDTAYPL